MTRKARERVLVEVKFGADLLDNQPAEYLRRLPDDGNVSVLLFVAPESRLERLWPEIRDMAKSGRFALNDVSETGPPAGRGRRRRQPGG